MTTAVTTAVAQMVPAHLIEFRSGHWVALPRHAVREVLHSVEVTEVPGAPGHCLGLVPWHDHWLPVVDMDALVHPGHRQRETTNHHLMVVAYRPGPDQALHYGALLLPTWPLAVQVGDDAPCPLPEDSDAWPRIALSCFEHEDRPVPIVDASRVFAPVDP